MYNDLEYFSEEDKREIEKTVQTLIKTASSELEAIEIKKGNIPLTKRENMPAPTYYVSSSEKENFADGESEKVN